MNRPHRPIWQDISFSGVTQAAMRLKFSGRVSDIEKRVKVGPHPLAHCASYCAAELTKEVTATGFTGPTES